MMGREVYEYVGDMKSISTQNFLPWSHKSFCYRTVALVQCRFCQHGFNYMYLKIIKYTEEKIAEC
jgi:hypothetical protein